MPGVAPALVKLTKLGALSARASGSVTMASSSQSFLPTGFPSLWQGRQDPAPCKEMRRSRVAGRLVIQTVIGRINPSFPSSNSCKKLKGTRSLFTSWRRGKQGLQEAHALFGAGKIGCMDIAGNYPGAPLDIPALLLDISPSF